MRAAFAAIAERGRGLAILVNNAGVARSAKFAATDAALWDEMLRVNLTGTFHCTQAALPALLAAPAGRVVNVASTAGLVGYPYVAAYCAAKHGVVGLTRALALELAATRVTVNAVCPGYTDTDMVGDAVANISRQDRPHRGRGAREPGRAQSAAAAGDAGGSRRDRRLALPAGVRGDHRTGDLRVRRRGHARMSAQRDPAEPDHESRLSDEHHESLRLWLRLLTCTMLIEQRVRARPARALRDLRCRAST